MKVEAVVRCRHFFLRDPGRKTGVFLFAAFGETVTIKEKRLKTHGDE
ncbi:hypothetical protein JW933_05345 [candidate division FCPU426 bacterium]|nr:hypothetical protein [candidate division FCPU426 bacterium]